MPFPYIKESIQAAVLSAVSNVLAQCIAAYRANRPFNLDLTPITLFVTYAVLNTPLNCAWQEWLQATFPGSPAPHDDKQHPDKFKAGKNKRADASSKNEENSGATGAKTQKLNVKNTLIKFSLDQTIGAALNTVAFVSGMGALKGLSWDEIVYAVQHDSIHIYLAGIRLWPAVSLLSFSVIPVDKRVLFGSLAGVAWGIFLSLQTTK